MMFPKPPAKEKKPYRWKRGRRKMSPEARAAYDAATYRAAGMCEARIEGVCTGRAEHRHHIQLRSRGGEHTVVNLLVCCDPCHLHIHAHPEWAEAHAFMAAS